MLKVYFGSDRHAVVEAVHKATENNTVESVTVDDRSYSPGMFVDFTSSVSLFESAQTYIIDTPSSNADFNAECVTALADMAESQNQFFVMEGALLAPAKKKFGKHAESIEEYTADKAERFNTFAMAEALARRDKKTLWMLLQEARLVGLREEEMIGILWWQLKSIRLAGVTESAGEAGMKEYPYKKAKQAVVNFPGNDVLRLSHSLLDLYHRSHKGLAQIDTSFEEWVLTV